MARAQQWPDSAGVQPRWSTPALTTHGTTSEPAAPSTARQRWPDLLEEGKNEPRAWEVYLRAQERRRRLDQEQKGAIWNA